MARIVRAAAGVVVRFFVWLFEDLRRVILGPRPVLPEEKIPVRGGQPDLSYYTEPLQHYIDLYRSFLNRKWKGLDARQQKLAWNQRVHGTWGLLAKGAEALPFLLTLVRHPNPDAREDGAYLLGLLKPEPRVPEELLRIMQSEQDLVARSAMIQALGKLRYRPAIPALASLIMDDEADMDTRWDAVDSLGAITNQDFSGERKLLKAQEWLRAREESK